MTKKSKNSKAFKMAQMGLVVALMVLGFSIGSKVNNNSLNIRKLIMGEVKPIGASISAKELNKVLENKDFLLINVHTPYEGEIIKTDTFIEYDSFLANKNLLPKDLDTKIILYCKSGLMSEEALLTLKDMGYTNISHLNGGMDAWQRENGKILNLSTLPEQVIPQEGFELPISWEDMGPRLISLGVIDKEKFEKAVDMTVEQKEILEIGKDTPIRIDTGNSQFVVDMLWAYGLAQKSLVYEQGPMGREYKAKAGDFASTGGWTLSKGNAMDYYNSHELISLTDDDHKRVMELASHVYRPCCGNHTAFPDCNHGMAALAAIELMVKNGIRDEDIYKNILKLNSFWFSSHYMMVATHFARQEIDWDKVDAKQVLEKDYSSGQAATNIYQKVGPLPYDGQQGGGGCGA